MNNSCSFTKGWMGHFGPKSNSHQKEILNEFFYKLLLNMLGIAILFTSHMIITVENIFILNNTQVHFKSIKIPNHIKICSLFHGSLFSTVNYNFVLYIIYIYKW
jgi:hypothetical protein